MKTIKKTFQILSFLILLGMAKNSQAQTCAANFTYYNFGNGTVSFTNTSVNTNSTTISYWNFGPATYSAVGNPGMFTQYTYTANGTYTVYLTIFSSAPSCSSTIAYTINVTACLLNINFSYSQGTNGLINFNNITTGTVAGTTYTWNYGDGSTSNNFSSSHTYTANGVYQVDLTANNNFSTFCVYTYTSLVVVNSICNLAANFTYTLGNNGLVNFTSTSLGTSTNTTYHWYFGNGVNFNGLNSTTASQTYTTNGTYVVTLVDSTSSPVCTSSISQSITISNVTVPCNLSANFTPTVGANGLVNFNNTTTGTIVGVGYNWSFGDGGTSSNFSPTHTYSNSGIYTVTLTAINNFSTNCVSTKTSVVIINLCNLSANFTHTVGANGMVNFNCTSTGTAGAWYYNWDFGDGFAGSGISPSHAYLSGGAHNVSLIVTYTNNVGVCSDTIVQSINITTLPCSANSNFSLNPTNTPQYWTATPSYPWNVTNAVWTWGDGSSSGGLYTSHNYSVAATYTVCLTVTVSCGSTASTCVSQYISKSANGESMNMISLNVVAPALIPTGINNLETKEVVFTISPNPSNGEFTVNMNGLKSDQVKISVYNLIGKLVYEANAEAADARLTKEIQTNNLSSGIYFIKATNYNNEFTKKIIINK
jgi:PKD repeat protein